MSASQPTEESPNPERYGEVLESDAVPSGVRAALDSFLKALTAVKTYTDKTTRELNEVELVRHRLATKGWAKEALQFLDQARYAQQAATSALFAKWSALRVDFDVPRKEHTVAVINAAEQEVSDDRLRCELGYKRFKDTVLADFARLR